MMNRELRPFRFDAEPLGGKPIGQAVQEARAAIKPSGDPTWLAYVAYADPLAALQQP